MSYGSNFWNNLRNDDIDLYRRATLAARLAKKLRKHELDLKFLNNLNKMNLSGLSFILFFFKLSYSSNF